MNTNEINLLVRFFLTAAKSEKLPPKSEDFNTILSNLSKLDTYKARVDYAEECLEHLSSGSSRVIYKMDDNVLKLGKNDRGVAQNKVEANPKMKSKYINPTSKADKDGVWKISPYLDKITEKEFEELVGFSFKDFGEVLAHETRDKDDTSSKPKIKDYEKIAKSDIVKELKRLCNDFDLLSGDLVRISSWGVKDKTPTLLDSGLNDEVFDQYYDTGEKKSSSKS